MAQVQFGRIVSSGYGPGFECGSIDEALTIYISLHSERKPNNSALILSTSIDARALIHPLFRKRNNLLH